MPVTFRLIKGSELTYEEMDENFRSLLHDATLTNNTLTLKKLGTGDVNIDLTPYSQSVDYVSNVTLSNDILDFTGVGNAFTGSIDLSQYLDNTNDIDYVSDVTLNGNSLDFTGVGNAFTGSIDLSQYLDNTDTYISSLDLNVNNIDEVTDSENYHPYSQNVDTGSLYTNNNDIKISKNQVTLTSYNLDITQLTAEHGPFNGPTDPAVSQVATDFSYSLPTELKIFNGSYATYGFRFKEGTQDWVQFYHPITVSYNTGTNSYTNKSAQVYYYFDLKNAQIGSVSYNNTNSSEVEVTLNISPIQGTTDEYEATATFEAKTSSTFTSYDLSISGIPSIAHADSSSSANPEVESDKGTINIGLFQLNEGSTLKDYLNNTTNDIITRSFVPKSTTYELDATLSDGSSITKDISEINSSIYNTDGELSENRIVTMSNKTLNFDGGNVGFGVTPQEKLDVNGNISLTGDVQITKSVLSNQENLNVLTGTETVASVSVNDYDTAFFDYVIKKGTNIRSGTVTSVHDGTNVDYTDTTTTSLGNTSDVTLSVDISNNELRLRAAATTDNWEVKSIVRGL